jgi:malonyl-CoA O-methyltransferase
MTNKQSVFSHISPEIYAEVSIVARLVAENMISRLELVTLQPQIILDIGCGTGYGAELLKQHYPNANVYAIDDQESMLRYASQKNKVICADALRLPLKKQSVDLIFANLLLPWCDHWENLFNEWRQLLRPNGLLMFTCFGVDTLREFEKSSLKITTMKDMHIIGDALLQAQFSDPVMDVEYFTANYRESEKLIYELSMSGMLSADANTNDILSVTYEIVYGHAWGSDVTGFTADDEGIVKIPLSHLRR